MRYRLAFAAWIAAFSTPTQAGPQGSRDPQTAAELVSAVEGTYASVNALRADFVQITRSPSLGQETRQRGRVHLERPRKMRWDFQQPDGSAFVTDGTTMWVWSAVNNQVIVGSATATAGGGMTQLLDDLSQLDELFTVTLMDGAGSEAKRSYTVELVPKKESSFKKLRLVVAKKRYTVEQVILTDAFDNVTDLSFSQVRIDEDIPDSMFTFQIPQGAQVIRTDGP